MRDIIFVAITVGFFALAAAYVRACMSLLGLDAAETGEPALAEPVDAGTAGA